MQSLSEINTITVPNLVENIKHGNWDYCRPEVYIRRGDKSESKNDKKVALLSIDSPQDSADKIELRGLKKMKKNVGTATVEILEPIVLEKSESGFNIISGNTRVKALVELFETLTLVVGETEIILDETDFIDVPFRYFDEPLTYREAIEFQTGTNDHTLSHSPYEIARMVAKVKEELNEQYSNATPKKRNGLVAEDLQSIFKCSRANISYYTTIIENGTDKLFELLENKEISLDTSVHLIRQVAKVKDLVLDKVLYNLIEASKSTNLQIVGEDKVNIYKKNVDDYFRIHHSETEAPSEEIQPTDGTPPSEVINDDVTLDKEELKQFDGYVDYVRNLNLDELREPKMFTPAVKLLSGLCDAISGSANYSNTDETIADDIKVIRDIFLKRFSNFSEDMLQVIDEQKDLNQITKVLGRVTKPVDGLKKAFIPDAVDETDDSKSSDSGVIELENDDYIAEAS